MLHKWILAMVAALTVAPAFANDLVGTYKLVSSQRKNVATNAVVDTYGPKPTGYIIYAADGRMMGLIAYDGRPKPKAIDGISEADKAKLFSTMLAYGGTYSFDGKSVTHHIDISWNEVWTGTDVVREITRDGDKLIYTTKPAPFSGTGEMSVVTLVWERVKQ